MILKPNTYVPSLRWRQAEYQALLRLSDAAKSRIVPFITIPDIEYDFELKRPSSTVEKHVKPFPKRYIAKWGKRPAWIDVHETIANSTMSDGKLVATHVFDELRKAKGGNSGVPVTSLDAPAAVNKAVADIVALDKRGVGFRIRLEHIMKAGFTSRLAALIKAIGVGSHEVDLVIDLGAPNYEPYEDFAAALLAAMSQMGDVSLYRSLVLLGTAYPESVKLDKPGGELPRHDWLFFEALMSKLDKGARRPNFGDYTIVHPKFEALDFRKIKSSGKVVYALKGKWHIRKGGAFTLNRAQMHDHCDFIVNSGFFRGADFSNGDEYIKKCATKSEGPSTLTRWKEIGISHHIMHVLEDLSTLYGPS